MRDALRDEGFEVRVAYDGKEVFNKLGEKPNLIILDLMMPYLDGLEVCQIIRNKVTCPILSLTARSEEADCIGGIAIGGDDYIGMPFSIQELKSRIQAHLCREQRNHQSKLLPLVMITPD
ncbi:response regulator [Viridibacillus sp. YIM B01967]|uniref:Response regulator n=2 Tax=Viridibacillus soli TaxID=2798301 RepID=A0ABS1HCK6_9BACL|nr:response regulator [Viridibacillus soli]